jgi:signal transduction histidine kinase
MISMRSQLLVRLSGGLACALLVGGMAAHLISRRVLLAQFDSAQTKAARALTALVEEDGEKLEFEYAGEPIPAFGSEEAPEYFQFWYADGRVLERSVSLGSGDLPKKGGSEGEPHFWDLSLPDGRAGRATRLEFAPRPDDDDNSLASSVIAKADPSATGMLTLVYARSREELDRTLLYLLLTLVGAAAAILILGRLVIRGVVARSTEPLARLAHGVERIGPTDLGRRFEMDESPEEIAALTRCLNNLLTRLEAAFIRERLFATAAAHELRTPLSELRTMLEVGLKEFEQNDLPSSPVSYFRDGLASTCQMENLAETLLALVRSESGILPVLRTRFDLARLVRELWDVHSTKAARELRTRLQTPDCAQVDSDRTLLSAILSNLFSNAVAYTPEGGEVSICLARVGERLRLTVTNSVAGLFGVDLDHIFEPFWRKDPARTVGMHCGLGLSLVKAYATLLGIEVRVDLCANNRFEVELVIPDVERDRADTGRELTRGNHIGD